MPIGNVNDEHNTKQDITWDVCAKQAENEIEACREKIAKLRKSLRFFKKQAEDGVPFPVPLDSRQKKLG